MNNGLRQEYNFPQSGAVHVGDGFSGFTPIDTKSLTGRKELRRGSLCPLDTGGLATETERSGVGGSATASSAPIRTVAEKPLRRTVL
jgi:hypothetical protein